MGWEKGRASRGQSRWSGAYMNTSVCDLIVNSLRFPGQPSRYAQNGDASAESDPVPSFLLEAFDWMGCKSQEPSLPRLPEFTNS